MEITHISEQNKDSFAPLLPKEEITDGALMLGCIEDDEACAVLVAEIDENIIKIRMIHTAQKFTNRGAAKALVERLCEIAGQLRVDAIYASFPMSPVLDHVMEVSGFSKDADECEKVYSFDFAGLDDEKIGKTTANKKNVMPLSKVLPTVSNQIKTSVNSIFDITIGSARLTDVYDPEISMVAADENDLKGYLLCKREKDVINISYLANMSKDNMLTLSLMKNFYETVRENIPEAPELKVRFKTSDPSVLDFVKAMVVTKIWEEDEIVTRYFFPPILEMN